MHFEGDGSVLHTLSLRPPVMYGEHDPWYVVSALRAARDRQDGSLIRIGDGSARLQTAYVGNVAWAHLCAARAMTADPGLTSGRPYFVTDDTPTENSFEAMRPFLAAKGFTLSEHAVPYPLAYACCWAVDWLLWVLKPVYKLNLEAC
jgi:nucleoside-diphosphate-sugar epimerase